MGEIGLDLIDQGVGTWLNDSFGNCLYIQKCTYRIDVGNRWDREGFWKVYSRCNIIFPIHILGMLQLMTSFDSNTLYPLYFTRFHHYYHSFTDKNTYVWIMIRSSARQQNLGPFA
jgi:hypothetical protein